MSAIALTVLAWVPKNHAQAPPAAGRLTAAVSSAAVKLRWTARADNPPSGGYRVWRRADPGSNWSQVGQTQAPSYTDRAVSAGSGYAYAVRSLDAAGHVSGSSAIVTARVPSDTSSSPITGSVLWKADAERPLTQEWAEYSTVTHCAVTSDRVTSDPEAFRESSVVAQGSRAYEFVMRNGDHCFGSRTEIGEALPERAIVSKPRLLNQGDDRWFSFQVRLGSDFPIHTQDWNVIAQWKQLASTTSVPVPMVALQVHNGAFYLEHSLGTATVSARTVPSRLATAVTRRWVKFSVHIKFSTNPAVAFVAVYGDPDGTGMRRLVRRRHFATLASDALGNPVPSHSRIGIYRSPAIIGTAHLFFDGYTVATTRSAAETNAFARRRPLAQ